MKIIISFLMTLFLALPASADFGLENISNSELESIVEDFGAVFLHTTVSSAGAYGKIFGFQLGIVGGLTTTPTVEDLSAEQNADVSGVPSGAVVAQLSVPLGLTVEASFIPSLELEDADLSNIGLGLKWTMTDTVLDLPVDLALRLAMNQSELSFIQNVAAVDVKTSFEATTTSASVIVGKSLVILKPYLGLGYVSTDGELSVAGANPIFDSGALKDSATASGLFYFGGAEVNLLVFQAGLEAMKIYDSTRYNLKLAFGF